MLTDEQIITEILKREGGWVDNPADKGGPTNFGITLAALSNWRGRQVTDVEVSLLTEAEAREIYRTRYIVRPGFGYLTDTWLRGFLVDCAVHHGQKNAVRFLQRALGVTDDGVLGPKTIGAANLAVAREVRANAVAERVRFFGRLITKDLTDADKDGIPDNTEFASGWLNRASEFIEDLAS